VGGIGLSWLPDQRGVYDVVVAGGGIVGLSTAYSLLRRWPGLEVALLEKERGLALHQTGHNSGVLHSGIYYPPGSLKARFAIAGRERLASFCAERGFAHERCGKVLLATSEAELPALERLYERGLEHELELRWPCPRELLEHEPHARGEAAVFVPETGIVDYREVSLMLAAEVEAVGGTLWTGHKVVGWRLREKEWWCRPRPVACRRRCSSTALVCTVTGWPRCAACGLG
jgi:(S)-2-hydroxyglutarate dehydrogenase